MNIRCNCGYYYNTEVYNNICPECEQTYVEKKVVSFKSANVDIDNHMNKLVDLYKFYKRRK